MIEELFVPYEEALLLKELGIGEFITYACGFYYTLNGKDYNFATPSQFDNIDETYDIGSNFYMVAPLYQQAFKFFRDNYGKNVLIFSDGFQWTFDIRHIDKDDLMQYPTKFYPPKEVDRQMFASYESAELECLKKLIEIIYRQ